MDHGRGAALPRDAEAPLASRMGFSQPNRDQATARLIAPGAIPLDRRKRKRQPVSIDRIQTSNAANDFVMQTASRRGGHRWKRGVAALLAAILLLTQSLAAAHFHPLPTRQKYAANAVVNAEDGLCAVCLFRIHSPTVAAVTPSMTAPGLLERVEFVAPESRLCSSYDSHLFGRAPPASA